MDYIKGVLREILKESAQQDSIIDAIKKKYEVMMSYSPDSNGKGGGKRLIQPVAYGTSKAGNPVVRAFQPYGDTTTHVPHWKLFRLDKINDWAPLKNRKFSNPESGQFGEIPSFNTEGDNGMSEVFVSSDFDNSKYEGGGLKKYNDNRHKDAVEKDQYHDIKNNMKKSIDGMQFDYIKKNVNDWQNSDAAKEFKGNQSSIYDMMSTNNFYNGNDTVTDGPIRKDSTENEVPSNDETKPNYNNASQNGPVFKGNQNTDDTENLGNDEGNSEEERIENNGQE